MMTRPDSVETPPGVSMEKQINAIVRNELNGSVRKLRNKGRRLLLAARELALVGVEIDDWKVGQAVDACRAAAKVIERVVEGMETTPIPVDLDVFES